MIYDLILFSNQEFSESQLTYHEDDQILLRELHREGIKAKVFAWENGIPSDAANAALFRTTWGYHLQLPLFKRFIQEVDRNFSLVWNSVDQIRWNLNKRYLFELAKKGCPIVRTKFIPSGQNFILQDLWSEFEVESLVIKPAVGASAINSFHIQIDDQVANIQNDLQVLRDQDILVQEFCSGIVEEGEYSLIFIDGSLTHSILKRPQENDFRVQAEHGGSYKKCSTPPKALQVAHKVLSSLHEEPLYARIDLVRENRDRFLIMEVELIEPQLFFALEEESATRLAQAIAKNL